MAPSPAATDAPVNNRRNTGQGGGLLSTWISSPDGRFTRAGKYFLLLTSFVFSHAGDILEYDDRNPLR
jgi:hypothetical protein